MEESRSSVTKQKQFEREKERELWGSFWDGARASIHQTRQFRNLVIVATRLVTCDELLSQLPAVYDHRFQVKTVSKDAHVMRQK